MQATYEYPTQRPLNVSQIRGVLLLLGILGCALLVKLAQTPDVNPAVQQARTAYEQEKIQYAQAKLQLKHEQLPHTNRLKMYGIMSLLGTLNLAVLICDYPSHTYHPLC